ncbi:MAG: TonB-dependent receptor [Bacteroidaceae bacterium]|nr:TonB-dependent receptor [Bacteroidaceae bacterium]MBR1541113.1 TonB-dependent receptor [Bacteroidaceae bacterium]
MKKKIFQTGRKAVRFRQFQNSPYAVFRSLKVEVTIGVLSVATLTFATPDTASAQVTLSPQTQEKLYELEEVEVTSSRAPLTLGQSARLVTVLDREAIAATPAQSVNDLLKLAAGVDVRQRGPIGAQTDISVRGGTNEQITILLNGININDPQTGHNAADFPVDISEIERIEVLEGPAGRVYGTSSLVGAINIVTRKETRTSADVHLEAGSFGYVSGGGRANVVSGSFNNQLSASYTRSDGYSRNQAGSLNSDFKTLKLFYQGHYDSDDVNISWHAGLSNKDYGSNTFYSAKFDDQFEHTLKFFTAVQAETKGFFHFKPSIYWNRSHDRFELIRGSEAKVPFNYHRTDVFGVNLNSYVDWALGKTAFGAEFRNEDLISGNLGEPLNKPLDIHGTDRQYTLGLNRSNLSFHLEHNILLRNFTLSAGVIAVKNTWNEMPFKLYPGVDVSWQFAKNFKAYASFNTSLRMPSFTELYYSVGGHKADKYLKPEEMQAYEVGVKYLSGGVRGTLSVYHHHGKNMIDWIRDTRQGDEAVWESVNHTKVNATGIEASLYFDFLTLLPAQRFLQNVNVAYSYIDQDKDLESYMQSQYALEYLKHKLTAQGNFNLVSRLFLNLSYRYQERKGNYQLLSGEVKPYGSYSVLDARLSWNADRYKLYVEANNIFDKTYYDYGNVPQPGFWFMAGASYKF